MVFDTVYILLGDLSRQKGVSINSIVRDAVDKWLKEQKEIPKRHHLLIYDNEESVKSLLESYMNWQRKANGLDVLSARLILQLLIYYQKN